MSIISKSVSIGAALLLSFSIWAADQHPGHVDFADFADFGDETLVDVRLGGWLMGLVRNAADGEEDLDVLRSINAVQVRVVEVGDADISDLRSRAQQMMSKLHAAGWEDLVSVKGSDEFVRIVVKGDEDRLQGITIVAIGDDQEAVFVNITGSIKPEQVAQLLSNEGVLDLDLNLDL